MSETKIYHNPRCSKSRQTLVLLEERGVDADICEYLNDPPTVEELDEICRRLGKEPQSILRVKEKRFAELGLSVADERSRQEWLQTMVDNPILIERPIVVRGKTAAVGRPPEAVLEIL